MSGREFEEEVDAPLSPVFSTLTKASHNDGACHASSDADGTEDESDANVEEQLDESTGKEIYAVEPLDEDSGTQAECHQCWPLEAAERRILQLANWGMDPSLQVSIELSLQT